MSCRDILLLSAVMPMPPQRAPIKTIHLMQSCKAAKGFGVMDNLLPVSLNEICHSAASSVVHCMLLPAYVTLAAAVYCVK
jgi:hypothetical protein